MKNMLMPFEREEDQVQIGSQISAACNTLTAQHILKQVSFDFLKAEN